MSSSLVANKEFRDKDFTGNRLPAEEYEDCSFSNCRLSQFNLSDIRFTDCSFINCDLSMAGIENTTFKDVIFRNCKMLGLQFDKSRTILFSVTFEDCRLNLSSFYRMSLRNSHFKNCSLREVDFTESDMSNIIIDRCNLDRAVFDHTNIEMTNFQTSFNFSIDPETNKVRKAIFSRDTLGGLLGKYELDIR